MLAVLLFIAGMFVEKLVFVVVSAFSCTYIRGYFK